MNRVDRMETATPLEQGGLARTISVVGLSISQAADELQQAAERLIAAEEQAREADLRVAAAEEQVALRRRPDGRAAHAAPAGARTVRWAPRR